MLLKALRRGRSSQNVTCFSTLYRVDAIEGRYGKAHLSGHGYVSVPSIGSMLLKASRSPPTRARRRRFSTLYRVDAIEGAAKSGDVVIVHAFQYPLSGRCY